MVGGRVTVRVRASVRARHLGIGIQPEYNKDFCHPKLISNPAPNPDPDPDPNPNLNADPNPNF